MLRAFFKLKAAVASTASEARKGVLSSGMGRDEGSRDLWHSLPHGQVRERVSDSKQTRLVYLMLWFIVNS